MENTIGERIDILRRRGNYSYSALAKIIEGITGDGVRKAIKRNSVTLYQIEILCNKLNWDKNYIERGNNAVNIVSEQIEAINIEGFFKPIPYYDLNVSAGSIFFLDNGLIKGQKPDDFLFVPKNVDADIVLPIYGNSMFPNISNGDKVAYKFIKDWSFFNYGMKYLIVTNEQRMVKYIKKSEVKGNILLSSSNSDYEDIEMPIKSIRNILQVRYIFKTEM